MYVVLLNLLILEGFANTLQNNMEKICHINRIMIQEYTL